MRLSKEKVQSAQFCVKPNALCGINNADQIV